MKKLLKFFDGLYISNHGKENFITATGMHWTLDAIMETIMASKMVKVKDLIMQGYNPNYFGRAERGIKSWYAISDQFKWDAVFVLSNRPDLLSIDKNSLALVTVLYNRIETWESCIKPKPFKPKPPECLQHLRPSTIWRSGNIDFQMIFERGKLMFKAYDKTENSYRYACTAEGRKRFKNANELAEILETELMFYKDENNSIHELEQPLIFIKELRRMK